MKSNYKPLGLFIEQYDLRANGNFYSLEDIRGISSITKEFNKTKANLVDVTIDKYKTVPPNYFAYNPNTARMGDKIPVALNKTNNDILVSSIYPVFRLDETKLLAEYLLLWFKRPEFDRYARYKSHGSAREIFDWNEMCKVELPVPEIEEQYRIVNAYKAISDRIKLKRKINDNLTSAAQAVFEDCFAEYYRGSLPLPNGWKKKTFSEVCQIKGGKRLPADCEFASSSTSHPYVRIRDMYQGKYLEITKDFEYIDDDVFACIRNYVVSSGDVIIAIVGITSGEIAIIGESLNGANLTENCVKLTKLKGVTAEYLYCYWQYLRKNGGIEPLLVGAAQPKLPMYNIQAVPVIVPDETSMANYQKRAANLAKGILNNTKEIECLREMQQLIVSRISSR